MHDLTITPQGHLLLRETATAPQDRPVPRALLDAYAASPARGMLDSASEDAALPPSFEFARSIGRLYLTSLCRAAIAEPGGAIPEVPPPPDELDRAALRAPPMTGLEYLNAAALAGWWHDLDALARSESERHPDGAQGYLRERNPEWRLVGRVTFHLAENKRDPDRPFAFLATFANGLTPQGKVRHEPLGRALEQYAGARNRRAMLNLLLPVSRAAESAEWVRRLVDSGDVYHPLAWSPRQAYEFLSSVPLLEASGLIVRVPDWWHARKPARPIVSVKIDSKRSGGLNVDAMMRLRRRREPRRRGARPGRDRRAARVDRRPGPAPGQVGRGRPREAAAGPGALEGGRAGRPPRGDLLLRGDATALRREPGQGGRGGRSGRRSANGRA